MCGAYCVIWYVMVCTVSHSYVFCTMSHWYVNCHYIFIMCNIALVYEVLPSLYCMLCHPLLCTVSHCFVECHHLCCLFVENVCERHQKLFVTNLFHSVRNEILCSGMIMVLHSV